MSENGLMKPCLVVILFAFCGPTAFAQVEDSDFYGYIPDVELMLGTGLSPIDITTVKDKCFEFTVTKGTNASLNAKMAWKAVRDEASFYTAVGIEPKLLASRLDIDRSSLFTFSVAQILDERNVSVVLNASSQFSSDSIDAPGNWTISKKVLADRVEFANKCGSHYVRRVRRGVAVSVIVTIVNAVDEERVGIKRLVAEDTGVQKVSASATVTPNAVLKNARKENRILINAVTIGGRGVVDFSLLLEGVRQAGDLDEIQGAIAKFLENFTADKAVPIGYEIKRIKVPGGSPPSTSKSEQRLLELAEHYHQLVAARNAAKAIIENRDPRSYAVSEAEEEAIRAAIPRFRKEIASYEDAHKRCKEAYGAEVACRLPSDISSLLAVVPTLHSKPKAEIRIETEAGMLEKPESRTFAARVPVHALLKSVRLSHPSTKWVKVWLILRGGAIENAQLKLGDADLSINYPNVLKETNWRILLYEEPGIDGVRLIKEANAILSNPLHMLERGAVFSGPISVVITDAYRRKTVYSLGTINASLRLVPQFYVPIDVGPIPAGLPIPTNAQVLPMVDNIEFKDFIE